MDSRIPRETPLGTPSLLGQKTPAGPRECEDMKMWRKKSERGASLLEYAALVALVALIAIAGVRSLEEPVKETVCKAVDGLDTQSDIWWEEGNCYTWVDGQYSPLF